MRGRKIQWSRFFSTVALAKKNFRSGRSVEELIHEIEQGHIDPTYTTLAAIIGLCENGDQAKRVHSIIGSHRGIDWHLDNQLFQIFVRLGEIDHAVKIFPDDSCWSVVSWTCILAANARNGNFGEASTILARMLLVGAAPDRIAFVAALQILQQPSDRDLARAMRSWIAEGGHSRDTIIGNALVAALARCGELSDARLAFDRIALKDRISWNSIIAAHVAAGSPKRALAIFGEMLLDGGVRPDAATFTSAITALESNLARLRSIHSLMIPDSLLESDTILATALLKIYAKNSKCPSAAFSLFCKIARYDLISVNAMIAAFAVHGYVNEMLDLFYRIVPDFGLRPDKVTFLNALGAIASTEHLTEGRRLHDAIRAARLESDLAIATALVDMYCKSGDLAAARELFDRIPRRDAVAWNAMLAGYARRADRRQCRPDGVTCRADPCLCRAALDLFAEMRRSVPPTRLSLASALAAAAAALDLETGIEIHALAAESGVALDLGGLLIQMYAACGDLDAATRVFAEDLDGAAAIRDASAWNSLVAAYAENRRWEDALHLVRLEQLHGVPLDAIGFVTALNACAAAACGGMPHGKDVHLCVAEAGLESDVIVRTALLNMYAKCGDLEAARGVFAALRGSGAALDLVAWNAMGSAFAQHDQSSLALDLYRRMLLEGVAPDEISFVFALAAAATLDAVEELHSHAVQRGVAHDVVVATVLVAAYGAIRAAHRAEAAFFAVPPPRRDAVLWNAVIGACGGTDAALHMYGAMDVPPDKLTLVLALNACASLAATSPGAEIHARAIELGFDRDEGVLTALIHFYAKCGQLERSEAVFHSARYRSTFMWNALISGFAQRGQSARAIKLFERMQQSGHRADAISFVSVLGACSQAGFVPRGCGYFASLVHDHGIVPCREHYACVIDLLGRAGRLEEAEEWLRRMPAHRQSRGSWETLLGACSIHDDVPRGRRAARELFEMQSRKSAPYVIMAKLATLSLESERHTLSSTAFVL